MLYKAVIVYELDRIAEHFKRCATVYPDLGFQENEQAARDAGILLRANCGNCHYFHEEHCVCADSEHCTDPRIANQLCECWEVKR